MRSGALYGKWQAWRSAAWWPAAMLVLVQTINGVWYMPQITFFPIYLQEDLGLAPGAIAAVVAGAQVAGMLAALVGGTVTGLWGSKWAYVAGLALSFVAVLALQTHVVWLVALLWFIGGAGLALITVGGASYLTRAGECAALGVLAAVYALSLTVGGSIGNPLAGLIIERYGFAAFGLAEMAAIAMAAIIAVCYMLYLGDRTSTPPSMRAFWTGALPLTYQARVRLLMGMRCLATVFYGMLTILIPLLLNDVTGSKAAVAAYGTSTLIVASVVQLLAGRAADRWGARLPTLLAFGCVVLASTGLALAHGTAWGLFLFGVTGVAAAWALSALMYIWVVDGVDPCDRPSSFGLLHAVWSLSMILGSLLGGWLIGTWPGLPFLVAGLGNVAALFLTQAFYGRIRRQASPPGPA